MAELRELVEYADRFLDVASFADYAPNGLQVEGRRELRTLISGVTASQALLEAALEAGADAVLVHHGYFWKGEDPRVVGMKARRLRALLCADVSLLAYHLPLDAHPQVGNNRQLADRLGLELQGEVETGMRPPLVLWGRLAKPLSGEEFARRIHTALGREPIHVAAERPVERVALCTGAGQRFIDAAAAAGVDAFVSGEISEPTAHSAREQGVHYYAAGHHATERYGVQALGAHLAEHFGLKHRFIDIDNPA